MHKKGIEIIFEDNSLVIVNKSAGMLTLPDRFDANKPNLYQMLTTKYGKIFVVHRLDKDTSGIICFAKTELAHRIISEQFNLRTVEKYYHAFIEGNPIEKEGTIVNYLTKHPVKAGLMIAARKGKKSITNWKIIESFKGYSILEAHIETGRTHQVRVHCKNLGFPLMVDEFYGRQSEFFLSQIKKRKFRLGKFNEERPLVTRATLHAKKLVFNHPDTEETTTFEVPYPKDLSALHKQLSKWAIAAE